MRYRRIGAAVLRRLKSHAGSIAGGVVGPVTHVKTRDRKVALTFDDGPHPLYTMRLLEILDRYGAKATFFVVGEAARRYPRIVQEIAGAGHAIGNHSWDHPSFPLLSRSERRRQLRACAEALAPYGCGLFRPPFGHHTWGALLDARLLGYTSVMWNTVGHDWYDRSAAFISEKVMRETTPGSIVLLHDALFTLADARHADRGETLSAVGAVLGGLGDSYEFVTVPELFRCGSIVRSTDTNMPDKSRLTWLGTLRRGDHILLPFPVSKGHSSRRQL